MSAGVTHFAGRVLGRMFTLLLVLALIVTIRESGGAGFFPSMGDYAEYFASARTYAIALALALFLNALDVWAGSSDQGREHAA